MNHKIGFLVFLFPLFSWSQTLKGTITDAKTKQPLETVAVYFDNTTVGTTTNQNGEFSIDYTDVIQSSLVISYLGYDKLVISNYRGKDHIDIALNPSSVVLDEVNLDDDDGLTRKQKLRIFRKEFLGTSRFGKSCKILNEDAIYLRYDAENNALYASSKVPLNIQNKAFSYAISYDLSDFEIQFKHINKSSAEYRLKYVYFLGTTFFKDLNPNKKSRSASRKREKAFKGSIQHFMRALYNKDLKTEGYTIFYDKFKVNPWDVIRIIPQSKSEKKTVFLKGRISILYNNKVRSDLNLAEDVSSFTIDAYGNFSPILGLYFTGQMSQLRAGDMLPIDYGL